MAGSRDCTGRANRDNASPDQRMQALADCTVTGGKMTQTKRFSLRTVLTVTTGRLLTAPTEDGGNGIGDLYEILGWITMESSPNTHQLGRFADECKPYLFRFFPELGLASACLPKLDAWMEKSPTCPEEGIKLWLAELQLLFPQRRSATPEG